MIFWQKIQQFNLQLQFKQKFSFRCKKMSKVFFCSGCSAWLIIATFARLPVSTTHSITGATLGFGLVMKGFSGIQWRTIINIGKLIFFFGK